MYGTLAPYICVMELYCYQLEYIHFFGKLGYVLKISIPGTRSADQDHSPLEEFTNTIIEFRDDFTLTGFCI